MSYYKKIGRFYHKYYMSMEDFKIHHLYLSPHRNISELLIHVDIHANGEYCHKSKPQMIPFQFLGHTHYECNKCGMTFCGDDVQWAYHECGKE